MKKDGEDGLKIFCFLWPRINTNAPHYAPPTRMNEKTLTVHLITMIIYSNLLSSHCSVFDIPDQYQKCRTCEGRQKCAFFASFTWSDYLLIVMEALILAQHSQMLLVFFTVFALYCLCNEVMADNDV